MTTIQPLLVGLVDDAGLLAPAALSMGDALDRHRAAEGGSPILTDRLLVPASRVEELLAGLDPAPLEVGLVVDGPLAGLDDAVRRLTADSRTRLTGVALRLRRPGAPADVTDAVAQVSAAVAGLAASVAVVVELPLDDELPVALDLLQRARLGAAVDATGTDPERLARFVRVAVTEGLPFTVTSGLQHAVSGVDEATGVRRHGFLNLLVATMRAVESRPVAEIARALEETDGEALAREATVAGDDLEQQVREHLVTFAAAEASGPVAELQDLGIA